MLSASYTVFDRLLGQRGTRAVLRKFMCRVQLAILLSAILFLLYFSTIGSTQAEARPRLSFSNSSKLTEPRGTIYRLAQPGNFC
jgi:hypothetical protein